MSEILDGRDLLNYNSFMAISMNGSLKDLLDGKNVKIPMGTLVMARHLFSVAADYARKEKNLSIVNTSCDPREISISHSLLTDMIKRTLKTDRKDPDSELEKLAVAMELLTPDGKAIIIAKESYQMLQGIFESMDNEARRYPSYHGGHSPYSFGTFDDDNE